MMILDSQSNYQRKWSKPVLWIDKWASPWSWMFWAVLPNVNIPVWYVPWADWFRVLYSAMHYCAVFCCFTCSPFEFYVPCCLARCVIAFCV